MPGHRVSYSAMTGHRCEPVLGRYPSTYPGWITNSMNWGGENEVCRFFNPRFHSLLRHSAPAQSVLARLYVCMMQAQR